MYLLAILKYEPDAIKVCFCLVFKKIQLNEPKIT